MSNWFRTYGFSEILENLLVGAYPVDREDVAMLTWVGVERILNLVEDAEYRPGEREEVQRALLEAGIQEYRLRFTDYAGLPPLELETAVTEVASWLDEGVRGYIHCRAGWQRSAAVAAGVVALHEGLDLDEALALVRARKPSADPLAHQREDLRHWWENRGRLRPGGGDGAASAVPLTPAEAVAPREAGAAPTGASPPPAAAAD